MKNILKPVRRTWSFFFGLIGLDFFVMVFGPWFINPYLDALWFWQTFWLSIFFYNLDFIDRTVSQGWLVFLGVLSILIILFVFYLIALFLSKKVFKQLRKKNKSQRPRFEMPDQG